MSKRIILILVLGVGIILSCEPNRKTLEVKNNGEANFKHNLEAVHQEEVEKPQVKESINELSEETESIEQVFNQPVLFGLDEILIEDFNGDGVNDTARFITGPQKSGIVLTHGNTYSELKFGLGNKFEEIGDDFSWVGSWGILIDSISYEIVIEDSEIKGDTIIELQNPSIVLINKETVGGLIAFRNGKYEWIHQAD